MLSDELDHRLFLGNDSVADRPVEISIADVPLARSRQWRWARLRPPEHAGCQRRARNAIRDWQSGA
jgi:hypothetical protein